MTQVNYARYEAKMNNVSKFILDHLDEDLTVEGLSEVACFSKFHFHRQFSAFFGMSVIQYVLLNRLKRSAQQLVFNTDKKIIDIAFDAHFKNAESFSRAFKKVVNQSPSQFRRMPDWSVWHQLLSPNNMLRMREMDVKIVEFDKTKVAVLEHLGNPLNVEKSVEKFRDWRKTTGLSPIVSSRSFGIIYSDPDVSNPETFRFDICGEIEVDLPDNEWGVISKEISGGRCAVLRHIGSLNHIGEKVRYLYADWLAESGQELRDEPCFFHYTNIETQGNEAELKTDIYLPIV